MNEMACRLYSAAQIRELEACAIASGISGRVLMQRAGAASWEALRGRWPQARRILVICGSGNNGGDGYVIARLAREAGCDVRVFQVGGMAQRGDAVQARADWLAAGGQAGVMLAELPPADVVVDALFGIGLTRDVQGEAAAAIDAMREARDRGAAVLAVDLPSGLDADSGRLWGAAVIVDLTISFIAGKAGLATGAAPGRCGQLLLDRLGIPDAIFDRIEPAATLLDAGLLPRLLPPRSRISHKGSHGHVLVVGGDRGMAGAALLAARAALRGGAGKVSLATRPAHALALTAAQPELMCHGVDSADDLQRLLSQVDVVAVGPGLGQNDWGQGLLARVLDSRLPLVMDADALNLLALEPARRDNWILTPHPGEAGRLLGCGAAEIERNRPGAAAAIQRRYGGAVVLKGAGSLVQGRRLAICPYGNPGMAVGGMGDALTGIIAALLAQGIGLEDAAEAGVLVHALAGDRAAQRGERGLLPTDLISELRSVVNPLPL